MSQKYKLYNLSLLILFLFLGGCASSRVEEYRATETGIALTYAAGGGTLSVGYETSTGTKDGNQFGVSYAMSLGGGTSVTVGYSSADVDSKSATQTDLAVSHSLGGGVSVFGEMRSVSGDTGTDTSTTSNSTMAIGTSISF